MKKIFSILAVSAMVLLSSCDKTGPTKDGTGIVFQPSWGQSFAYANKAVPSQVPYTILCIVLLAAAVFVAYMVGIQKKQWFGNWSGLVIAFIVAISLWPLLAKPGAVRMDNVRTVPKEYFDRVGQDYILDSMFNSNHLINAAVK